MKTFLYLRKSRAEDLSDSTGDTLRRHRETLEETARSLGLDVCGVYEEVVSGEDLYARPEMLRLLRDVRDGACEAVLCMDIDRLGRGTMSQQGVILETFKEAGVKIITPQKTYDLLDEMDEDYTELQTFFARKELKLIKKRMRRGVERTAADGGYLANAPYGYCKTRLGKLPTLSVNEEEAAFVKQMFLLYAQGEGAPAIARFLNACGAHPRRSERFTRSAVTAILHNPVYTGAIVWNRRRFVRSAGQTPLCRKIENDPEHWLVTEGKHPALISRELFDRVQQRFQNRCRTSGGVRSLVNPFAGLIRCANCGGLMQLRPRTGKPGGYLLCERRGCCPSCDFDAASEALHDALLPLLRRIPISDSMSGPLDDRRAELLIRAQKKLETQRAKLCELLETGVYSPELYEERLRILHEQEEKLTEQLSMLSPSLQPQRQTHPLTAADALAHAGPAEENHLWKLLISTILYRKEPGSQRNCFTLEIRLRCLPPL